MRKAALFVISMLAAVTAYASPDGALFVEKRAAMVEGQIEARGIDDERVLSAMKKVERHLFVSPALREFAYDDRPLPIGYGQTISQPFIVAYMAAVAGIGSSDRVLEIGAGSGYGAAVLAELGREVYSVEIIKDLADDARGRLGALGYKNVKVRCGDGYDGWLEYAPFDRIIVTAAPPEIPERLLGQLKPGGKMVVPVGAQSQDIYLIVKTEEGYNKTRLIPVSFVPMVDGRR